MSKVIDLPVVTRLNIPADKILKMAAEVGLTEVVILGYDKDGGYYFASSEASGGDIIWLLEYTKHRLFEACGDD